MVRFLTLVTSVLLVPGTGFAATYHVAKTGSDTAGNGSAAQPWATVQKAINSIAGGDGVLVEAGVYDERVTIPATKSGTAAATTQLLAVGSVVVSKGMAVYSSYTEIEGFEITPGQDPSGLSWSDASGHLHVFGSHNTLTNINVHDIAYPGTGITFGIDASHNVLDGFVVRHVVDYGIFFFASWNSPKGVGAHHNVARNGTVTDFGGWAGVNMAGASNTIENLDIYGPSGWQPSVPDGDGVRFIGPEMTVRRCRVHVRQEHDPVGTGMPHTDQLQFWKYADGLVIEDSIIGSTEAGSFEAKKGSCLMAEVPAGETIDFTVRNCVFLNSTQASFGGGLTSKNVSGGTLRAHLFNNVFWTPGLGLTAGSVLRNNIFKNFSTWPVNLAIDSDYNLFLTGCTLNPNEGTHSFVVSDPMFANLDVSAASQFGITADWRLQAGSPAIDKGILDPSTPALDREGLPRNGPPDIGAHEYWPSVVNDAGLFLDAGPFEDAGSPAPVDAGGDAGGHWDSGTGAAADAGPSSATDAGSPSSVDSGSMPDASLVTPATDAASVPHASADAGSSPGNDGGGEDSGDRPFEAITAGCGCGAAVPGEGPWPAALLVAGLALRPPSRRAQRKP